MDTGTGILFIAGLALLILGAECLVRGASRLAGLMGLSPLVIGLTVVAYGTSAPEMAVSARSVLAGQAGLTIIAAGTSLPEVATSIVASMRGQRDIAVCNVVGSNLFNILAVLGLASLVAPPGIHVSAGVLRFDLPVMLAVAVACLPIFFTGHVIARWEGLLFLGYYGVYTLYLVLAATQHQTLPVFSIIMLAFAIPLTGITVIVVWIRAIRARSHRVPISPSRHRRD